MPLDDLIAEAAKRFPEKAAVLAQSEGISFRALYLKSRQVAARLLKLGVGPGTRVAILHENAISAVVLFWGTVASGAQVVDVPCLAGVSTIQEILDECKPAALVASWRQLERLTQAGANSLPSAVIVDSSEARHFVGNSYHSLQEILASEPTDAELPAVHDSSVALIVYTSGTTGRPKGVMLSHRNLLSNICAANSRVGLTNNDSILLLVPLHFIHGRMQLLTHALIGGTVVLSAGFQFPQEVVRELAAHKVTGVSGVPYHFSTLLERTDLGKCRLPSLRYLLITGGAMHPEGLQSLAEVLPDVSIHLAYGQTEASPRITYLGPSEVLDNPGSSGVALPGVLVEIVAEDGSTLPQGMAGEVVVSGPNIMCGYVSADETSSQKLDFFGRLHTGDIGRLDNRGHLYLIGRKSDLIKSAGERVFPREVEVILDVHPAVRESAVIGIPDPSLGERIVACVVLKPGLTVEAEALRTHCLKFLPLVRAPREIRFASDLPKTASGKIDRRCAEAQFNQLGSARANV